MAKTSKPQSEPKSHSAIESRASHRQKALPWGDDSPQAEQHRNLHALVRTSSKVKQLSAIREVIRPQPPSHVVQLAKDAEEMRGIEGFKYEDIIKWDGRELVHKGVHFVADTSVFVFNATLVKKLGKKYMRIRFNPKQVGTMTPSARYFGIMHELAHIHHEHPGNKHPDSMLNELQADDTALVNTVTLKPDKAFRVVSDIAAFIDKMENLGFKGGGTHPDNPTRKRRVKSLLQAIFKLAKVGVTIENNFTPKATMDAFLQKHAKALKIDRGDVHTFDAQNGKFSYLSGKGTVPLIDYLRWLPEFHARRGGIPKFRYRYRWVVKPVTIQNRVKNSLPGS